MTVNSFSALAFASSWLFDMISDVGYSIIAKFLYFLNNTMHILHNLYTQPSSHKCSFKIIQCVTDTPAIEHNKVKCA